MRKLLATTALVALISTPVFAETKPADTQMQTQAGQSGTYLYIFDVKTLGATDARGYLASNLMGREIYASAAEGADEIGEVNDILIGDNGSIQAVIVSVGGFLGIGEKDVAIEFGRLSMERTGDGEFRVVSEVSKEELESAQAYERPEQIASWYDRMGTDMRRDTARTEVTAAPKEEVVSVEVTTQDNTGNVSGMRVREPITDREAFMADKTVVAFESLSAEQLIDANVYDEAGNHVGEIGDVLLTSEGTIEAALIDVGGFLGIGEKAVAVSFEDVEILQDGDGDLYITTKYTQDQLENAQAYDEKTWATDREKMLVAPRG